MESNMQKVKPFDGSNFSNWKFRVKILLEEKSLEKFLTSSLDTLLRDAPVDAKDEVKNERIRDTLKCDEKKCKSILVQCIGDSQLEYIKDKQELDVVCHLILTLPKSLDGLVTAMETMDTTKITIEFVKSRLLDECGKRAACGNGRSGRSSDSMAMQADRSKVICHRCKKPGHIKVNCRVKLSKKNVVDNKKSVGANCAEKDDNPEFLLCEQQDVISESVGSNDDVASCCMGAKT